MSCLQVSRNKRFSVAAKISGNDDLLLEILVLLPAKSAVRFKSVSKQWLSLISGKLFTDLHIRNHWGHNSETQHSFILADSYGKQIFLCHSTSKKLARVSLLRPVRYLHMKIPPWEYLKKFKVVKVLQSVNGLLLLSLKFESIDHYVVFNPTTKQYRFIDLNGYSPRGICLIFDPSKPKYYKLAMNTTASSILWLSVYDFATHKWTHGTDFPELRSKPAHRNLHDLCTSLILDHTIGGPGWSDFSKPGEFFRLSLEQMEEENKCCFHIGMMTDDRRKIQKDVTLDFGKPIGLLGLIMEERIEDTAYLFHVPGRLLIFRFSDDEQDDLEVLVDYRSDYFYEEDQLQFQYALPFVHTFASETAIL